MNVASIAGFTPARAGRLRAAKAGVFALTRTLAVEAAPHGSRVNCLAPAGSAPSSPAHVVGPGDQPALSPGPARPLADVEELAAAAAAASDAGSYITAPPWW